MLVRVMREGQPKYIRSDNVVSVQIGNAPDESPFCIVEYENDNTMTDQEVDGTPDEVFKALFNPPEMIEKEKVANVLGRAHASLSGMYGRGEVMAARRAMETVAEALGLKVRE